VNLSIRRNCQDSVRVVSGLCQEMADAPALPNLIKVPSPKPQRSLCQEIQTQIKPNPDAIQIIP